MNADLLPVLAGVAARGAVVLAFAWGLTALMRRGSASARHLVWTCALAAALLIPAAAFVTPRWQVEAPVPLITLPAPSGVDEPVTSAAPPQAARAQPVATVASATLAPSSIDAASVVVTLWAAGTSAVLLYLSAGFVSAWRLRRRASTAAEASREEVQALAEAFEIAQPILVVQADLPTTPMVLGVWRPSIVMPRDAAAWPEERRHVVLLHELAHIKRRDCLTQILAQVVCAAYWFNPLAWLAARRLRAERERACDDFVLAAGTRGSDYAAHLLDIAQRVPARLTPIAAATVAMAGQGTPLRRSGRQRSQLEGRLMAILDPETRRSSAFYTRFAGAALVALMSVPVAAIQLVPPPAIGAAQLQQAPPARATPDEIMRYTLNRTMIDFAEDGHINGVTAMLDAGADVNAQILGEGTALVNAAEEGHLDVVRLLLDRGANPNLMVPGESSPLTGAAGEGHLAIVDLLLQRGADVSLVAGGDQTALIQAAGEGHLDIVKLLVSRGADVNQGVMAERRPEFIDVAIVSLGLRLDRLVDRPAAPERSQPARSGPELRTPLSEARDEGHLDIVTFLIGAGARD
jgi:beta-lactamase regulating signal transducer with metallopeptidase domain